MLTLANAFGWCVAHWRILAAIVGLIVLAAVLWWADGAYTAYRQRLVANALNNANAKIANDQIQGNILEAEKGRRKQEVINAQIEVNKAVNDIDNVRRTDVNKFNANASAVNDRYCRDYPEDCR